MLAPRQWRRVASHQIALNFSSLVFMPLSIGVGDHPGSVTTGRSTRDQARVAARTGLMLGMGVAAATAALTVLLRDPSRGSATGRPAGDRPAATPALLLRRHLYQISDSRRWVAAAFCAVTARIPRPSSTSPSSPGQGWSLPTGMILGLTDCGTA